ncbi:MAG: DUF6078 family protein [Bacteroides uniformis]
MILLQDVPDGYEYCFAGNGKCPKASSCLRAIAAQLLSESEAPPTTVRSCGESFFMSAACPGPPPVPVTAPASSCTMPAV